MTEASEAAAAAAAAAAAEIGKHIIDASVIITHDGPKFRDSNYSNLSGEYAQLLNLHVVYSVGRSRKAIEEVIQRLKQQLAKTFPEFKPFIIDGKDMEEMFRSTAKFLRDAAEQHRKQDEGEAGSPSVVYDNVCDEFELVVDYCRELKIENERLKQQLAKCQWNNAESSKELIDDLSDALRLIIGREDNTPWHEVSQSGVISYLREIRKLKQKLADATDKEKESSDD